jgi:hypothetical protein
LSYLPDLTSITLIPDSLAVFDVGATDGLYRNY